MMKAIIVDDESRARSLLSTLLEEYVQDIEVVASASNLLEGVGAIKAYQPDIVFMDIEMPGHNGLDLLKFIPKEQVNFELIFTTAYSQYAIQAFELSALDYLLKPLRPEQVKAAVEKAKVSKGRNQIHEKLVELSNNLTSQEFKKIGLPVNDGIHFVPFEELVFLEADAMYTKVFTLNFETHLISKPLKYFDELLANTKGFYRTHRSFIINVIHVKRLVKKNGCHLVMVNDQTVSISREKKKEILELLSSYTV